MSYYLDDDSRDGLDPIALINQLIEQQPGVKLVKDLEPEALYIYGKVLTVERKQKFIAVLHAVVLIVHDMFSCFLFGTWCGLFHCWQSSHLYCSCLDYEFFLSFTYFLIQVVLFVSLCINSINNIIYFIVGCIKYF